MRDRLAVILRSVAETFVIPACFQPNYQGGRLLGIGM